MAGRRFDLGSVESSFDGVRTAATRNLRGIHVVRTAGDPNGFIDVVLDPGGFVTAGGTRLPVGGGLAVLVEANVRVTGSTGGRVTVMSDPSRTDGRGGTIRISGDLRTTDPDGVIGLFTEGDVQLDASRCVSVVQAAIIAGGGALTIDRGLRTDVAQQDAPRCGAITVRGSVAAAEAPVLRWAWANGAWTGYDRRSYEWDARLVRHAPPWAPVIDSWQHVAWREAPTACWSAPPWNDDAQRCR